MNSVEAKMPSPVAEIANALERARAEGARAERARIAERVEPVVDLCFDRNTPKDVLRDFAAKLLEEPHEKLD